MFAFTLGTQQILILLALGVLLFGKRLPEVGRSLGKALQEFKGGLNGIEEAGEKMLFHSDPPATARVPERLTGPVPRFEGTEEKAPQVEA